MRVGIYARVSTDAQEARGTIGSQLETVRARVASEGDKLVAEFIDDGYSGARLDRPGLDALRDAAEAGSIDAVWCLSPDRLARSYAIRSSSSMSWSATRCRCASLMPRPSTNPKGACWCKSKA